MVRCLIFEISVPTNYPYVCCCCLVSLFYDYIFGGSSTRLLRKFGSQIWFGLMANNGLCVMCFFVLFHLFVVDRSDNVLTVTIRDFCFDRLSVIG